MATLIRNNIIIADTAEKWNNLKRKPKINEAVVEEDNTSISLNVVWKGTSAEYQALPLKHPNTFYVITDSELPSDEKNYLLHTNKPKINNVELIGDTSLEELELYSRDEVDAFLRQVGAILVVSEETWEQIEADPTIGKSNTIYYVETGEEGAYRTYMVDANYSIRFLGENSAFFVEYQKSKPVVRNGNVIKPEIISGDNTVVGAANTIGDVNELKTANKSNLTSAINEIKKNKLGTDYVDIDQTIFGYYKSDVKNHQYKLATIEFNEPYSYFTGSFKFLSTYKNFILSGTEIDFNFRCEGSPTNTLSMYELKSYDVPLSMKEGQAIIWVYYSKPNTWPQKAEIWLQTKGLSYQEFTGEWRVKNKFNYPLGAYELIEKPVDDQSFVHLNNGSYSLDLGRQKNNMMVLEGEMEISSHTSLTRNEIKTLADNKLEYVLSSIKFSTNAEAPGGNANQVYNIHTISTGKGLAIYATNIDTNYEYRSVWDGNNWSDWEYIYGVDGGVGGLTELTTAPKIDLGTNNKNTVKDLTFTYNCIDMGEYYINELRIRFKDAEANFNGQVIKDKVYGVDTKLMSFSSIKGKPIVDNGYYATSFVMVDNGKFQYAWMEDIRAGVAYMNKDKLIMIGPRLFRSNDGKSSGSFIPWKWYTSDPDYPTFIEFNFLTRK